MISSIEAGKRAIFVLGMHRSGTSALTGMLNLLGVELGGKDALLPARSDNPAGFWENKTAMEINEDLLSQLGRRWSSVTELPEAWMESEAAAVALGRAISLLEMNFKDAPVWALKDPRICRLAPLWFKAATLAGSSSRDALIVCRDPREVCRSLAARDGLAPGVSSLLWVQHVLEAERYSRGMPRTVITYHQLIRDWASVAGRIGRELRLEWPLAVASVTAQVDDFINADYRHHEFGEEADDNEVSMLARELYAVCVAIEGGDLSQWERFHDLGARYEAARDVFGLAIEATVGEIRALENSIAVDRAAVESDRQEERSFFQTHIDKQNSQINALNSNVIQLTQQAVDLIRSNTDKDSANRVLAETLEDRTNHVERLESQQALNEEERDALSQQVEKQRELVAVLSEEVGRSNTQIIALAAELQEARGSIRIQQERIQELVESEQDLQASLRQRESECDELQRVALGGRWKKLLSSLRGRRGAK